MTAKYAPLTMALLAHMAMSGIPAFASPDAGDRPVLRVSAAVTTTSIEVGEPIELRLSFANGGRVPFFLFRRPTLGREQLEIWASGVEGRVDVTKSIVDFDEQAERFFYVPLWSDRTLEERLRLNDVEATLFHELPITVPGRYTLHMRFVSNTPEVVGPYWPIWSGDLEVAPIPIDLRSPPERSISRWREQLERCAVAACEEGSGAARYFALVRDQRAAELLVDLIDRYPANYGLAKALGRQCGSRYAAVLRGLVKRPEYGPRMKAFLEELARQAESSPGCE